MHRSGRLGWLQSDEAATEWNQNRLNFTEVRWEGETVTGGRRGRRCCFMLLDLQCHNREMLAYYNHCEPKLRGFSNATLRLYWYEVFRLTCVRRYINSGSSLPCTVAVVVAAAAGLKQTSRCPSAHLPSPPLYLCQVHMTANSLNVPHGFTYLQAAVSNFTPA